MRYRTGRLLRLVLLLLAVAGRPGALASSMETQTYQGIPYLSGGIAEEEREALRQKEGEYNVKLIFAAKAGNYVADVQVTIEDGEGHKILAAISNGPWFYTRLPPGKYTIIAQVGGQTQRQVAQVSQQKQTQVPFYW